MSDANKNLKIGINLATTKTGPDPAAEVKKTIAELQELKRQAIATGVSTNELDKELATAEKTLASLNKTVPEHEGKVHGLNKAVQLLGATAGGTGQALYHLWHFMSSPLTLALAAVAIGIEIVQEKFAKWREEIEETKSRLLAIEWGKFDLLREAISNATTEQHKFNTAMNEAGQVDDKVKEAFDARMAFLDAEFERKKNLLKLNEELEIADLESQTSSQLAGAGKNEAERQFIQERAKSKEEAIRSRYGNARTGLEGGNDARKLGDLQAELSLREGDAARLERAARSTRAAAEAHPKSDDVRSAKSGLADAKSEVEKKFKKFNDLGGEEMFKTLQESVASGSETFAQSFLDIKKAKEELDEAVEKNGGLQRAVDDFANAQEDLNHAADKAQSSYTKNAEAINSLRTKIGPAKTKAAQNNDNTIFGAATDAARAGHGDEAKLVRDAAAGADAINTGQKASADQARAIAQLTQMLNLQGAGNETILSMFGRMNDTQQGFLNSLKAVEKKVESLAQRHTDSLSR